MDREKVIEGLEDIQKHLDAGYSFAICWKSELIRDALALLKEQEQERRWIPVSERLPEEKETIFAKLKGTDKWQITEGEG